MEACDSAQSPLLRSHSSSNGMIFSVRTRARSFSSARRGVYANSIL